MLSENSEIEQATLNQEIAVSDDSNSEENFSGITEENTKVMDDPEKSDKEDLPKSEEKNPKKRKFSFSIEYLIGNSEPKKKHMQNSNFTQYVSPYVGKYYPDRDTKAENDSDAVCMKNYHHLSTHGRTEEYAPVRTNSVSPNEGFFHEETSKYSPGSNSRFSLTELSPPARQFSPQSQPLHSTPAKKSENIGKYKHLHMELQYILERE